MPSVALVSGAGSCPVCGTQVLTGVQCQWGMLPAPQYKLGESVTWLKDEKDQIVAPFEMRKTGQNKWHWNCGDPKFENVILFDVLFESDVFTKDFRCPNCKTRIVTGAVIVKEGKFQEVRALADVDVDTILGGSRGKADIVIIQENGTLWPREDWYDHVIKVKL